MTVSTTAAIQKCTHKGTDEQNEVSSIRKGGDRCQKRWPPLSRWHRWNRDSCSKVGAWLRHSHGHKGAGQRLSLPRWRPCCSRGLAALLAALLPSERTSARICPALVAPPHFKPEFSLATRPFHPHVGGHKIRRWQCNSILRRNKFRRWALLAPQFQLKERRRDPTRRTSVDG